MGLPKIIKRILPKSWLYKIELDQAHKSMIGSMNEVEWRKNGCPGAAPSSVKWATIRNNKAKYEATHFIETGTFLGDTSFEMKDDFNQVDTIELDEKLAGMAINRFAPFKNVKVWQGDSGKKIVDVLNTIPNDKICLFWLDGHFSGGITAKADLNTPISKEIEAIYDHNKKHIILIDDARLFINCEEDYPSLGELMKQIKLYNPAAIIEVKDDIIIVKPS